MGILGGAGGTGVRIATASVRTGFAMTGSFTWGAVGGPSGKSAKRCQWQRKRAGFEEVPRLAGTTVPVSRLARRWAREPLPYAPQGTRRAGRTGSSAPTHDFVGAILAVARPMTTAPPCKNPCHCEEAKYIQLSALSIHIFHLIHKNHSFYFCLKGAYTIKYRKCLRPGTKAAIII